MKKIIATFVVMVVLTPNVSLAQTFLYSTDRDSILTLITILMKRIEELQAQVSAKNADIAKVKFDTSTKKRLNELLDKHSEYIRQVNAEKCGPTTYDNSKGSATFSCDSLKKLLNDVRKQIIEIHPNWVGTSEWLRGGSALDAHERRLDAEKKNEIQVSYDKLIEKAKSIRTDLSSNNCRPFVSTSSYYTVQYQKCTDLSSSLSRLRDEAKKYSDILNIQLDPSFDYWGA